MRLNLNLSRTASLLLLLTTSHGALALPVNFGDASMSTKSIHRRGVSSSQTELSGRSEVPIVLSPRGPVQKKAVQAPRVKAAANRPTASRKQAGAKAKSRPGRKPAVSIKAPGRNGGKRNKASGKAGVATNRPKPGKKLSVGAKGGKKGGAAGKLPQSAKTRTRTTSGGAAAAGGGGGSSNTAQQTTNAGITIPPPPSRPPPVPPQGPLVLPPHPDYPHTWTPGYRPPTPPLSNSGGNSPQSPNGPLTPTQGGFPLNPQVVRPSSPGPQSPVIRPLTPPAPQNQNNA